MKKKLVAFLIFNSSFLILDSSIAQMFWNQTASFNGSSSSYISTPNSSSLDLTGSFTLEAWVNPTSLATLPKGVISKGGLLGTFLKYGVRILTNGRITINTNGAQRIISRASNPVLINNWTHISCSYNSVSSLFSIYINGMLDTSATVASAAPTTNSDSLFIGISGSSTPFSGKLDEVRVWNRELSSAEVALYFRTSLTASSGIYSGLILSMPFQKESSSGTLFTTRDLSGNENNGNQRNVSAVDQSFRPLQTLSQNDNIELDGDEDYLAGKDTSTLNPSTEILVECYVYPRAVQTCNLVTKGNQYALMLQNNFLQAKINGTVVTSNSSIPLNQWSKITLQYNGALEFHLDGLYINQNFPYLGTLTGGTDSIYIGGVPGATGDFNGFMDEVKILNKFYSIDDSVFMMTYKSIDKSNSPFPQTMICYNLDGSLIDNAEGGGPRLNFRNNARFSHPGGSSSIKPVTPLNRDPLNSMTNGFYLGDRNLRLPLAGTTGTATNLIKINQNIIITDVDVFIALNHTNLSSLNITIIGPNNDSVRIAENLSTTTLDNSLNTIFDDQADSAFASNRYVSFHTKMKPKNNLNPVFAGDNALGVWKIRVTDIATGDTGLMSMCGIKINNMSFIEYNFFLSNFIQGLYDPAADETINDTMTMYLRESTSPYAKVDSSVRLCNDFGESPMSFRNIIPNSLYYVQVLHRNSIETWAANLVLFKYFRSSRIFYLADFAAVGSNQIQVDSGPDRYAFYSGDENQDGNIDVTDVVNIYNDLNNSGYVPTDINGDQFVDVTDLLITYNNATNVISVITP